jgi:hypothetical protein
MVFDKEGRMKFPKIFIRLRTLCAFVIICGTMTSPVIADENILGLEDHINYDIHIGGYHFGASQVVQNVEIIGLRDIAGLTFLVIQSDRFLGKRSQGLILFQNIQAILPAHRVIQIEQKGKI